MFKLNGRRALITGATSGIGEEIAHSFHRRGVIVGLHGTRRDKLDELSQKLGIQEAHVFPVDFTDRSAVQKFAKTAVQDMEGIDILVNNAGITRDALFVRMSDDDWDHVLSVNLTAVFNLTHEIARAMMRRRFGRIINITSVVGISGNVGQTNYCAAKAGLIGFSKALAQEIAVRNVTVNCIAPGFIETAMTDKLCSRIKEELVKKIPMKRMGQSSDIAAAVVYLASDESAYITGQTLHINGGMVMV
ncbi:MAG: 3-oxoacyl-[acyl-carrier protein] reductase [Candidatus Tokpelaia sp. JSC085]|nr:MAG: 3-oxoacyl-[acyl-carrier protein] reductase [Candidatus Tokpelaia sp. JSC085]